jgi:DNA-directed RNA polymerase specialized sigma24 family protein
MHPKTLKRHQEVNALLNCLSKPGQQTSANQNKVHHALKSLPDDLQRILRAVHLQYLSFGAVATELGIAAHDISSLVVHAEKRFLLAFNKPSIHRIPPPEVKIKENPAVSKEMTRHWRGPIF